MLRVVHEFNDNQMSDKPRVQHMSWIQHQHRDPDINKAKPTPLHPPTHKHENLNAELSTSNKVAVKGIKMKDDIL